MINKNMSATDDWHTSTPLLCRHDSGYGRYSKHYGLLELSPIRKQSSYVQQLEDRVKWLENPDRINPRKLNFWSSCNENNGGSESDSGIGSNIDASVSESNNITSKTQYAVDENSNFISVMSAGSEYQPSKYICKDHSYKDITSKRNVDPSKIFKSYSIASHLFKPVNNSKIDFLSELNIRNCTSIISEILACLSDEDLRRANNVSKNWRDIISNDKSNNRRIIYIKNKKNAAKGPNKENKSKIATPERDHKSAFMSLVNVVNDTKQPLTFETIQGRYDSFIQELKIDGKRIILKCPKCRYPARTDTELKYYCTRSLCKHEFCRKCLGPFLDNHKCAILELNGSLSSIVVGSKKSRKNLRRLKA